MIQNAKLKGIPRQLYNQGDSRTQPHYIFSSVQMIYVKEGGADTLKLTDSKETYEYVVDYFKGLDREHLLAIHLSTPNTVLSVETVSIGSVNMAITEPREIFKGAILSNSAKIILAHNHPGGTLTPSPEDLEICEKIVKVGRLVRIPLIDNLIVTDSGYTSLRDFVNMDD